MYGSIISNPNKIRILNSIKRKKSDIKSISKSVRLPEKILESLLRELIKDGFVEEREGMYGITEEGLKALKYAEGIRYER